MIGLFVGSAVMYRLILASSLCQPFNIIVETIDYNLVVFDDVDNALPFFAPIGRMAFSRVGTLNESGKQLFCRENTIRNGRKINSYIPSFASRRFKVDWRINIVF